MQSLPKNHPLGQESFSVIRYTGQRAPSAGVFIPASLAVLPPRKSLVKSVAIYPGVQLLTVIFGNLSKFATNQVSGGMRATFLPTQGSSS